MLKKLSGKQVWMAQFAHKSRLKSVYRTRIKDGELSIAKAPFCSLSVLLSVLSSKSLIMLPLKFCPQFLYVHMPMLVSASQNGTLL